MIILFSLLMPLAFAATPSEMTPTPECEVELIEPTGVTTVEVRLDGFEAVEGLMRSLPPAPVQSGLRRVLGLIARRLRYGSTPDITGDVLANLHSLKRDFDGYGGWIREKGEDAFRVTLIRDNSVNLFASGFKRRLIFPQWHSDREQHLEYAQRMVILSGVENGQSTISFTLVVSLRGNLALLTFEDRALIERAHEDGSALLPAMPASIEHQPE